MTTPSKCDENPEALEGTSGLPSDGSETVLYSTDSSDSGKLTRAGVPTSTYWHMENLARPISGRFSHVAAIGRDKVNEVSQVVVSITELDATGKPFLGDAPMEIFNVVPDDGNVWVRGHVHYDRALMVRLNYIIFN